MNLEQLKEEIRLEKEAMMNAIFPSERMEHANRIVELEKQDRDRMLDRQARLIDEYQAKIEECRRRIGVICSDKGE